MVQLVWMKPAPGEFPFFRWRGSRCGKSARGDLQVVFFFRFFFFFHISSSLSTRTLTWSSRCSRRMSHRRRKLWRALLTSITGGCTIADFLSWNCVLTLTTLKEQSLHYRSTHQIAFARTHWESHRRRSLGVFHLWSPGQSLMCPKTHSP